VPEQAWFVNAYNQVGRPRIAVFVNRTLEGGVVLPTPNNAPNPAYLQPGEYDEAMLKDLDYRQLERLLTDWLRCDGKVTMLSPTAVREHLTDQQVRDLQQGRPGVATQAAMASGADILVQVSARPVRRYTPGGPAGVAMLMVAEALNVKGGESLSDATVEVPLPVDKVVLNDYTRFIARKLMHGMIGTWSGTPDANPPAPPAASPNVAPAPTTPPAGPMPPNSERFVPAPSTGQSTPGTILPG
jgi:hypothetical protein